MVKLERSKVEAIENFPVPVTKREIRSFLGLNDYYRKSGMGLFDVMYCAICISAHACKGRHFFE